MPRSTNILRRFSPRTVVGFSILFRGQPVHADKSGPIRLDDLFSFRSDIKQDWDACTTIILVGSLERQLRLFPLWLGRHNDAGVESVELSPRDRRFSCGSRHSGQS